MLSGFVSSQYLWVSRHKAVDVVVDLLEHEASVHQIETTLQNHGGQAMKKKLNIHMNQHCNVQNVSGFLLNEKRVEAVSVAPDLDEDCQAVVGIPGSIQIVLVFLCDVRHHHVDQSLHCVMERCWETLIPGQLKNTRMFIEKPLRELEQAQVVFGQSNWHLLLGSLSLWATDFKYSQNDTAGNIFFSYMRNLLIWFSHTSSCCFKYAKEHQMRIDLNLETVLVLFLFGNNYRA